MTRKHWQIIAAEREHNRRLRVIVGFQAVIIAVQFAAIGCFLLKELAR